MTRCLVCAAPTRPFLSFGPMPLANGFLREDEFAAEEFHPLEAALCASCAMPQLVHPVPRERMFNERYPFFTASSSAMAAHFARFAADVRRRWLSAADPLVVEIGSNDGTLLRHFAVSGTRHVGVEPSANVAAVALAAGVRCTQRFFDEDTASDIAAAHGRADAILAANCFCHVADLNALARSLDILLARDGVVVFEDPYAGDILARCAYDQIYDEHVYYFSATAVARWLAPHGFELIDVARQEVHGGSMRYALARTGAHPVGDSVAALLAEERSRGLDGIAPFLDLARAVSRSREALVALLREAKSGGKRVAGYGATSKSTTLLNYCGITPELVEFISDTTPLKQGKFSPGMHIPVRPHGDFAARPPDYALLFAWNHAAEILAKERAFREAGGRWIVYVPEVKVLD
ncbi:MAG: class I SAM-dependent methyltransferase [Usitatibacter sp.]